MGGSIEFEEFKKMLSHPAYNHIQNFVETGFYKGDTSMVASSIFKNVYSVEICEQLYNQFNSSLHEKQIKNVKTYLGDSLEKLSEIVDNVQDEDCVFYIDAHISGGDSGWNGKDRVPVFEELDIILSTSSLRNVFIINDVRLWKSKVFDWAHISNSKIIKFFTDRKIEIQLFYELNDRLYIFTR